MPDLSSYAAELPAFDRMVTLGEGVTPVLELDTVAGRLGLHRLSAKMEICNPTGSYKDRIAAMSVSLAVQRGDRGWVATSSGNAGLAMAAYGARARLPGFLCLVGSAPLWKRLPLVPYGVDIVAIDGVGQHSTATSDEELFEQVRAAAVRRDLYVGITAHAFNPDGMRGVDTIGYELADELPAATHFYVPVGGGGLLTAIGRGLARRAMPAALVACQPTGCAPVVGYLDGSLAVPEITRCESKISALQLARPPDGALAAEAVRVSDGWGTAVTDEEIYAAQRMLAAMEGISVEPASAAGLAALIADVQDARLSRKDHPVLILTGAGWKDLQRFAAHAERIPHIGPTDVGARIDTWADSLAQTPRVG